jgi:hypothetical protein
MDSTSIIVISVWTSFFAILLLMVLLMRWKRWAYAEQSKSKEKQEKRNVHIRGNFVRHSNTSIDKDYELLQDAVLGELASIHMEEYLLLP